MPKLDEEATIGYHDDSKGNDVGKSDVKRSQSDQADTETETEEGQDTSNREIDSSRKDPDGVVDQKVLGAEDAEDTEGAKDAEEEDVPEDEEQWYLNIPSPAEAVNPLAALQQIPEIPSDAPPLLLPMLQHLSDVVGFDELKLLDLRDLIPPPALGANLLMIVATARSERHLQIAADRFCGWLRAEHNLRPKPDGLMGRGELKLKLRRRAKRARMLSKVGALDSSNRDDGLTTGWVCVNVGGIPSSVDGSRGKEPNPDDIYIGFNDDSDLVQVVVQMMTAEKRETLGLELLWTQAIGRHERRLERLRKGGNIEETDHNVSESESNTRSYPSSGRRQYRETMSRRQITTAARSSRMPTDSDSAVLFKSSSTLQNESGDPCKDELQTLFLSLAALPQLEGYDALNDRNSWFWEAFRDVYPSRPSVKEAEWRLKMLCQARNFGIQPWRPAAMDMFTWIENNYIHIPPTTYIVALSACLGFTDQDTPEIREECIHRAMHILEQMAIRGHRTDLPKIRDMLGKAILSLPSERSAKSSLRPDAFRRFLQLCPPAQDSDESINFTQLHQQLKACAQSGRWDDFWYIWNAPAREMRRRNPPTYLYMFGLLSQLEHQREMQKALRRCISDMESELPAVNLTSQLAREIRRCLLVAEPRVDEMAKSSDGFGEWALLWRRCMKAESGSG